MNILSSVIKKATIFFGSKAPKIKMSWDGDISLKIGSDIAAIVFIANYLIPKYQDFDFSVSINRFTRRELNSETIIDKTGVVGYQIIAKRKHKIQDKDSFVFCFLLLGKTNKEEWLREDFGLQRTLEKDYSESAVLDFVPIAVSEMFCEGDKILKSTPFSEGDFPFELLSIVL